jgi:hypothetical protein
MCTVSWIHQGSGYQLLCNRDEKRTRRPASAPQLLTRNNVRFVAPIDGDSGGTWVAVNEFGLSLVLLNRAPSSAAKTEPRIAADEFDPCTDSDRAQ